MAPNESPIDYLAESERLINRPGRSLNIVTGCRHWKGDDPICTVPCYARRMVEHGRLKGNKAYPYGFEPTFHPERIKHYRRRDKRPMLIFLNTLGDVGGDWDWSIFDVKPSEPEASWVDSEAIAREMVRFANLNPEHIILLLTKNPAWYGLVEWPENVWCGITATNNKELAERTDGQLPWDIERVWFSLEPWYDLEPPETMYIGKGDFTVIGGQTHPNKPVSKATLKWLSEPFDSKRFVKANAMQGDFVSYGLGANSPTIWLKDLPQEYPEEFRYKP